MLSVNGGMGRKSRGGELLGVSLVLIPHARVRERVLALLCRVERHGRLLIHCAHTRCGFGVSIAGTKGRGRPYTTLHAVPIDCVASCIARGPSIQPNHILLIAVQTELPSARRVSKGRVGIVGGREGLRLRIGELHAIVGLQPSSGRVGR